MNTIYFDPPGDDEVRRSRIYGGQLLIYSPRPSTLAFCRFAREMIEQAFPGLDPQTAQHHMPVEQFAAILGELKPKFIHHPQSKAYLRDILSELGFDLQKTYFDVPRMRSSTSEGYLTSGIAYAWHPHRDTWYSAPSCQVNWWMPIYELESDNAMAFHPRYWTEAVPNTSGEYDYAEWNRVYRPNAAQHIKEDPRPLPRATVKVELEPQIRPLCPVGGVVMFSGAQMHSSVPNTSGKTRYSIDFRTVHIDDVRARRGAPNIDSACTGTTMNDYLRGTDQAHIPEDLVAEYEARPAARTTAPTLP